MARRNTPDILEDQMLDGLGDLDRDPEPAAAVPARRGPGRPRKTTGAKATTRKAPARGSGGRIVSKAALVKQATEEIELFLGLLAGVWSFRDPECADVGMAAVPDVAKRVAAMVSRSDYLLGLVSSGGLLVEALGLATALKPVVTAVWRAHGPNGDGHGEREVTWSNDDFPAYSSAH